MNETNRACPECGAANEGSAQFCTTCGHDLVARSLDWRARVLFFATPPFLLCLGMAFAWDLGIVDSFEVGAEWGLSLAFVFMAFGGGFWGGTRLLNIHGDSHLPWVAGMYSILQMGATIVLLIPIRVLLLEEQLKNMSSERVALVQFGIFLALFLPLTLIGLYALARLPKQPRAWMGMVGVLLLTLLVPGGIILALPAGDRQFLLGQIKGEFFFNDSALDNLNRALERSPDSPRLLHAKGRLLLRRTGTSSTREALDLFNRAVQADPRNAAIRHSLATAYDLLGKTDEAIAAASAAVSLQPDELVYLVELGDLYVKNYRREEALAVYRQAMPLGPDNPLLQNNISYLLLELRRDIPAALSLARKAVEQRPNDVSCLDTLAWALYLHGSVAEAYSVIKDLKGKTQGNPVIEFHYAVIANDLGFLKDPEKVFRRLLGNVENLGDALLYQETLAAIASAAAQAKVTPPAEVNPAEQTEATGTVTASGSEQVAPERTGP